MFYNYYTNNGLGKDGENFNTYVMPALNVGLQEFQSFVTAKYGSAAAQEAAASEAAAQKAAAEAAKKAAVEMIDGHTYWENKSKIEARIAEKYATTPPEVVLPDNMPTVQPQEEKKGSGILVPALLFAVGALAAIVLVKSKPKRR